MRALVHRCCTLYRSILTGLAVTLFVSGLAAQQNTGTISGLVRSEAGAPLAGVQVYLVGTGLGTLSGPNGRYAIVNVPAGNYRVRAELIGHRMADQSVTLAAGQTATANFDMKEQALGLDEIVVTGTAGAARRREVGNSVAQINTSKIQQPPASVDALIQGRAAGMQVMPSSAMAGSGSMIRLRGNVSVAMSNQPLIYVDGVRLRSDSYARNVPFTGSDLRSGNDTASPLNDVNPNDIERIEIIKGAAAATLYGTEAAAGVIQIFTKQGHTGKPQWTFQIDQGMSRALKFGPDPSTAPPSDTIPKIYRDSFPDRFAGLPAVGVSRAGGTSSYLFIDPWLRDALRQRYTLSVGGGGEALRYFVSGVMTDEDGVLPNDNEKKSVIRGNFSFTPLANLLFTWNTSYSRDRISNTAAGNNAHGLTLNAFRRDRNYASNDRPEIVNLMLNQEITSDIDHLTTGGTASWSPIANLTNKFTVGYDMAQIENRNLRPFGFILAPTGIVSSRRHQYRTLTFDYVGGYTLNLNPDLRSTLSWGGQSVTTDTRETSAYGENFPGPGKPVVSSGGTTLGSEDLQRVINAGVFGQALFDMKDRYFLTVGLRVDGNSAFGSDFGLQTYPKASLSWVASDESFWPTELIPAMKFRAAWGQSGRAPGAFDAVRVWDPVGWGGQPAFFPLRVGNADLGPERTTELEVGADLAFWDNRVTTELTYYTRSTDQALFRVSQIPSLGFLNTQLQNVGEMGSSGVEATVDAVIVRKSNFEWSVGGTYYSSKGEVKTLGGAASFSLGNFGRIVEGQPIPVIQTDFCVLNADEQAAPRIGSLTATDPALKSDCIHGPNLPTQTWGMNTSLTLPHGISLVARGEYMGGHYMYDGAAFNAVQRSVRWPGCYEFYTLQETGKLDQAKAIDRARCTVSTTRSDYFIYPADFFKLRELSLSIPIPARFAPGTTSARLTLAGQNIWKWQNEGFPVFDPETGNNDGFDSRVRSILEHVPPPATYTASLRITF